MKCMCGTVENVLNLGEFHECVKNHCQAIIKEPSLLLSSNAHPTTGALEGEVWDQPDLMYHVACLGNTLPHLELVLVAFFQGALNTWECFTTEFASDSTISQATPAQRNSVWGSPTTNTSEGALGQCCQMLQHAPTMSDNQRNARVMWVQNETQTFANNILTQEDHLFVRKEAWAVDASGDTQKAQLEQNHAWECRAESNQTKKNKADERKAATKRQLAMVQLMDGATLDELMGLTAALLDKQVDKLQELDQGLIQPKSKLGGKRLKAGAVLEALKLQNISQSALGALNGENEAYMGEEELLEVGSEEDSDMDIDPYTDC